MVKKEVKETTKEVKVEEPKVVKFEDLDLSACVNLVKARRAFNGVFGGAKGSSAELDLANKLRGLNPKLTKEELVIEVYKGLLGLLDPVRAAKNRVNEKKDAVRKASK